MQDARRFGLPEEAIDAIRSALSLSAAGEVEVWPEHADIVDAFLAASSQWRTSPIGGGMAAPVNVFWLGLDYAGARIGIELAGIAITPELWAGVRVMEGAARDALNGVRE